MKKLILIIVAFIIITLAAVIFLIVPFYIENNLCRELAGRLNVRQISCKLSGFGFNHMLFTDINVSNNEEPFLRIDSIKMNYSVWNLLYGKIDNMDVYGLHYTLEVNDRKNAVKSQIRQKMKSVEPVTKSIKKALPVQIEKCNIMDSEIILLYDRTMMLQIPVTANIQFDGSAYHVNCVSTSSGGIFSFNSIIDFNNGIASAHAVIKDLDFQKLSVSIPRLKDFQLSGTLNMDSHIRYQESGTADQGKVICSMLLKARNLSCMGKFKMEESELSLHSVDLLSFKSLPNQTFTFKSFSSGKVSVESGKVFFQIDSLYDYFIESMILSMWDGSISFDSFNVKLGHDYKFSMLCENLNVGKMFEQLNIGDASGEGTLNGIIPVTMNKNGFEIEDAILTSLPGKGGCIELWKSSMTNETVEESEEQKKKGKVDVKALVGFSYDKVKLNIKTKGDEMLIGINVHGSPSLQFNITYKKPGKKNSGNSDNMNNSGLFSVEFTYNYKFPIDSINRSIGSLNKIIK